MENPPFKRNALALILLMLCLLPTTLASESSPQIVVHIAPDIIAADGGRHEIITVELQTPKGEPYLAPEETRIYLSLTNEEIGSVEPVVVIPEGKSYVKAVFKSSGKAGFGIVTAGAPNFQPGEAYLQALGSNFDARLRVYAHPSSQPAVPGAKGNVTVQLLDSNGEPFTALQDVHVRITSSNSTICRVTPSLVIPQGRNYGVALFEIVGSRPGTALISAQATGFEPGSDLVNTFNSSGRPSQLSLYLGPETLMPDNSTHQTLTIQLQDLYGEPAPAANETVVYLSSSNPEVAVAQENVTITPGQYHVKANVTTREGNGETMISASSQGLYPDFERLTVQGHTPIALNLFIAPAKIIAVEDQHPIVTIQLLDEEGNPVNARRDTEVTLLSTNTAIGLLPETALLPKDTNYITVSFQCTGLPGSTEITATAPSLEPAEATLETITKNFNLTLTTPPTIKINQTFTIQIQATAEGHPLPNVRVEWSALGGVILESDDYTDGDGVAEARLTQKYEQLKLRITASKPGYETQETQKTIQIAQEIESKELTITLLGREIKVFHILVALAITIALALAAYLYIKYRRTDEIEELDLDVYG